MKIRTLYYIKYKSFAIKKHNNDNKFIMLWKLYTPKFEDLMNNNRVTFFKNDVIYMDWDVNSLIEGKECLIRMIFENV
jgi:hypothetical protein